MLELIGGILITWLFVKWCNNHISSGGGKHPSLRQVLPQKTNQCGLKQFSRLLHKKVKRNGYVFRRSHRNNFALIPHLQVDGKEDGVVLDCSISLALSLILCRKNAVLQVVKNQTKIWKMILRPKCTTSSLRTVVSARGTFSSMLSAGPLHAVFQNGHPSFR